MSSLLVIGGSGFFGKSILDSYRRGHLTGWGIDKIFIFSRNASQLQVNDPILVNKSVELIDGDISCCSSLPEADYIIHAAASSDASKYINAPEEEKKNILAGAINFCNMVKRSAVSSKILYVSSGAVYGASSPKMLPFEEDDIFIPLGEIEEGKRHYAAAKRDSEAQIILLGMQGFNVAIARCFSFVGKYLPRNQHFAIGNFIQNGLDGEPINVRATKKVYRSYMHADDLVQWLFAIVDISDPSCPIFNVGSEEIIEMGSLAELIAERYGVKVHRGELQGGDIDFYVPSVRKIQNLLGMNLRAGRNLNMAINETVKALEGSELRKL